jgi:hypothetical protein
MGWQSEAPGLKKTGVFQLRRFHGYVFAEQAQIFHMCTNLTRTPLYDRE